MNLQEQINKILLEKKISRYELAKDTEINESQLSKFFNYKINLSMDNVCKIADYLQYEIKLISVDKKDAKS